MSETPRNYCPVQKKMCEVTKKMVTLDAKLKEKTFREWATALTEDPTFLGAFYHLKFQQFFEKPNRTDEDFIRMFAKWGFGIYACSTCRRKMDNLLRDIQFHFDDLIEEQQLESIFQDFDTLC